MLVDASIWSRYRSGILTGCGLQMNHAVVLVGETPDYWKIKNSWGANWGENGFIRISRTENNGNCCAICQYAAQYVPQ